MTALVLALGAAAAVAWAAVVAIVGDDGDPEPDIAPPVRRRRLSLLVERALAERGVAGDVGGWCRVGVGAGVVVAAVGLVRGGPVGAVVTLGVAGVALAVLARATRGRGARLADDQLPVLLEHTSRGLRSGLDLRSALADAAARAGAHGPAAASVVHRVDGGAAWDEALAGWADDAPRPPVRLVAAALSLARASGGRAAHALDGVAATLRARRAVAQEARSLATQAQASAAVLVALPLVVSVGGAVADPRLADALLGTTWGLACIVAAVALDAIGALWMHRIVAASAR